MYKTHHKLAAESCEEHHGFCNCVEAPKTSLVFVESGTKVNSAYTVSQKTCDYIFYNNFNNRCPITVIFGIVSSKSVRHPSNDGFISHLTYLVQLPYLGKSQNTKNDQFRCKQHIVL